MCDKIRLLGLAASSNIVTADPEADMGALKDNIGLALLLVAIIVVCLLINYLAPKVKEAISDKKERNKEAENQAELDRLHKIKEKNKRK